MPWPPVWLARCEPKGALILLFPLGLITKKIAEFPEALSVSFLFFFIEDIFNKSLLIDFQKNLWNFLFWKKSQKFDFTKIGENVQIWKN